MSNLQVERANFVEARAANPYGDSTANIIDNYEAKSTVEIAEDKQYEGLQRAEASYFFAGTRLNNSSALQKFNIIAKQRGYDNVNLIHRHDVN